MGKVLLVEGMAGTKSVRPGGWPHTGSWELEDTEERVMRVETLA